MKTRLHSRRMRTARALTVSPSMLCAGWGLVRWVWGVAGLGGCLVWGVVSQHALSQTLPPTSKVGLFCKHFAKNYMKTRLHSSRMRTARALTVSPSMLCAGWGLVRWVWGVAGLGGCLVRGVWLVWGGAWSGGCLVWGVVSQHALSQTLPPTSKVGLFCKHFAKNYMKTRLTVSPSMLCAGWGLVRWVWGVAGLGVPRAPLGSTNGLEALQ